MLMQLLPAWGSLVTNNSSGSNVVETGAVNTNLTCSDFNFDFKNATITGSVEIKVGSGELFCGEGGVGTKPLDLSKDVPTDIPVYHASTGANGELSLKPADAT